MYVEGIKGYILLDFWNFIVWEDVFNIVLQVFRKFLYFVISYFGFKTIEKVNSHNILYFDIFILNI